MQNIVGKQSCLCFVGLFRPDSILPYHVSSLFMYRLLLSGDYGTWNQLVDTTATTALL